MVQGGWNEVIFNIPPTQTVLRFYGNNSIITLWWPSTMPCRAPEATDGVFGKVSGLHSRIPHLPAPRRGEQTGEARRRRKTRRTVTTGVEPRPGGEEGGREGGIEEG